MDNNDMLRRASKALFACLGLLVLTVALYFAGFASAYLLTGSGTLPSWSVPPPAATPVSPGEEATPSGVPPTLTPLPVPTPTNEDEEAFQVFWEVWAIVQRDYYGDVPEMEEVTHAAIRGMLSTLDDDYTIYFEPEIAKIREEDATGEYEGIGAYVDVDEAGKLVIVEPIEGGPAEEAGLLAGDRVIAVDGVSIVGYSLYEAIALVRGPAGSEVTLLVEREGEPEPFEVTITRARLEIEITRVEMLEDNIGYIRLREFSAPASARVEAGVEELLAQEPRGIVFDLRMNPGGWLDQAIEVSDIFLSDGVILTERWKGGDEQEYKAHDGDVGEDIPLVVLVDRGSASASEIVAGALQDHGRAILIGETTFGKGAVQRVFTLSDGSQLMVTSALWYTPNNQPIHGQGLTPDIEVLWPEELEPGEDPQLERAVEYFLTGE